MLSIQELGATRQVWQEIGARQSGRSLHSAEVGLAAGLGGNGEESLHGETQRSVNAPNMPTVGRSINSS